MKATKIFLVSVFALLFFFSFSTLQSNNPCPCDCDEILTGEDGNNTLVMHRGVTDPNCYDIEMTLNACGYREIWGFSLGLPDPNCFQGKRVQIFMDYGDGLNDLGIVDLGETGIPSYFQLENAIQPCTSREIFFKVCFVDDDGGDCFGDGVNPNSYQIAVDYAFGEGNEDCETQDVTMTFKVLLSVENKLPITEIFEVDYEHLRVKEDYQGSQIKVYDINGQAQIETSNNELNLSNLNSGFYIIILTNNNLSVSTTYIKKR